MILLSAFLGWPKRILLSNRASISFVSSYGSYMLLIIHDILASQHWISWLFHAQQSKLLSNSPWSIHLFYKTPFLNIQFYLLTPGDDIKYHS